MFVAATTYGLTDEDFLHRIIVIHPPPMFFFFQILNHFALFTAYFTKKIWQLVDYRIYDFLLKTLKLEL